MEDECHGNVLEVFVVVRVGNPPDAGMVLSVEDTDEESEREEESESAGKGWCWGEGRFEGSPFGGGALGGWAMGGWGAW